METPPAPFSPPPAPVDAFPAESCARATFGVAPEAGRAGVVAPAPAPVASDTFGTPLNAFAGETVLAGTTVGRD